MTKQQLEKELGRPVSDEEFQKVANARGERAEFAAPPPAVSYATTAPAPAPAPAPQVPPGMGVMIQPETAYFDQKTGTWIQMVPPTQPKPVPEWKQPVIGDDGTVFQYPPARATGPAASQYQAAPYSDVEWQIAETKQQLADQQNQLLSLQDKSASTPTVKRLGEVLVSEKPRGKTKA